MKINSFFILIFTLLFTPFIAHNQENGSGFFIENKGQVLDFNENFHPEVKYYYSDPNAAVYFQKDRLVYNFKKTEQLDLALLENDRKAMEEALKTQKATYYRMDMVFQNSKSNATILPGEKGQGVTHFYLNKRNGIRDVHSYKTIQYQNIYNQIDAVFYQSQNGLKYDLILKEGAKIEDIQLKFEGAVIKKVGEQLVISTAHSDITEEIPLSFINGDKNNVVEVNYVLENDGTVRFKLKKNIHFNSLTIDPILEWGSYFIGSTDGIGYTNNYLDDDGFYYTYGMASSSANTYPVTNPGGAYAALSAGSADAYFMQFNSARQLVWSTYLGGSGYEQIYNTQGIAIKGNTLHLVGEKITAGAPFTNGGGFYEANVNRMFWARFNKTNGTLQHLTSLSGGAYPSIDVSPTGQVVIACHAYNFSNFTPLARAGAYNQSTNAGSTDFAISLFNNTNTHIWSTFFGGPGNQEVMYCKFDDTENIYFQGETSWFTASTITNEKLVQLPGAYYQSTIAGANDIALGKFNTAGQLVWHTLFGGNSSDARRGQQGSPGRILFHPTTKELILAFNTTSSNLPIVNLPGAYNKTVPTHPDFAAGGSYTNYAAYICKFSTTGALNWGTYYYTGTGGGDIIENIAFGKCEKFYVGSAGIATKPLVGATSGYNLLSGTTNSRSGYITMMSSTTFAREWDSYLNSDVSSEAHVAANINRPEFYAATKLYYNNLPTVNPGNGAYFNASNPVPTGGGFGISQFHPSLPPDVLIPTPACAGASVTLTASGGMGAPYNWYATLTSTPALHTGSTFTVSPTVTTTYYVSSGTGDCASPRIPVEVVVNPVVGTPPTISGTNSICNGSNTVLTLNNSDPLITYTWRTGSCALGLSIGTGTTVTVTPTTTTTYYVSYTDACGAQCLNYPVTVNQPGSGTASISQTTFCGTTSATLTLASAVGAIQWQQSTNGGTTWTNIVGATTTPYTVNGISVTTSFRAVLTTTGCPSVNSNVVTITSTPNLTANVVVTGAPTGSICAGTSVTFTASPTNGGATPTYQWQINGVDVSGATGSTFTSTTLANNDVVTVVMASNNPCVSNPSSTSSGVTIVVGGTVTASVVITGAPVSSICAGTSVTFTANPTNGGTTPTYQWQINGVDVAGATGTTFTSTILANNDVVTVVMTSNDPCVPSPTVASAGSTITVGGTIIASVAITGAPTSAICAGSSITFTANPTNGGPAPTYQWQINGVNVAGATGTTFTSTTLTNNDVVSVQMISNDPCVTTTTVSSTGSTISVTGTVTPSVAITGAPTGSICSGSSITFTAVPTNGGTTPTYQWQINGINVSGATSSTFTSTTLANSDVVTVILTSSEACATTPSATSAGSTITVSGSVTPSVAISGAPAATICAGSSVTFTANPTNGGATPTYQWQINGVNVSGATGTTFTTTALANNDIVTVIMTSNDPCASTPTATSSGSTITVGGVVTPSVAVTGAPTGSICTGTSVTFTANPTNGGTTPTYQWQINGVNVPGATNSTFTSTTLSNNDIVTVIMTSNDPCAATATGTSTGITITVGGSVTPTVTITGNPVGSICSGTSVTFTANPTNGGTAPTYQWQINGTNVAGATGSTFSSTTLSNNDVVTVIMTSSDPCAATPTATSAGSNVTVVATVTPSVTVTGAPTTVICGGTSVTFTANPTNGGTAPTYQWQINGVNVPGATGVNFTSTTLNNNDVVTVIMTSSEPCTTSASSTSAGSTISVSSTINATISSTPIPCGSTNTGTATVVVSGGTVPYTFNWSPTGGNAATASNLVAGIYTVIITDDAGCSKTLTTTVTSSPGITLVTTATPVDCGTKNGSATATATGGTGTITYVWNPGNLTGQTINNLSVGTYTVTATDGSGCTATSTVFVGQNGSLNLQANPYTAIVEEGSSINLNASFSPYIPGTTYDWTPPNGLSCTDCPNPIASPTETTTYNVQITTPDGCTADTNITLTFKLKCGEYFVPTIFSPNGDGQNDEFKIYGKCITSIKMKVYDRWGELVFQSDDQSYGWDGTYKGQMMNSASFVYLIDVTFVDERIEHVKGNVSLVR